MNFLCLLQRYEWEEVSAAWASQIGFKEPPAACGPPGVQRQEQHPPVESWLLQGGQDPEQGSLPSAQGSKWRKGVSPATGGIWVHRVSAAPQAEQTILAALLEVTSPKLRTLFIVFVPFPFAWDG